MPLPPPRADGTCLVTGASSGIGTEIARQFARRGYGLTLVARREELLHQLADDLASAHGVRAEAAGADVSDERARAALPDLLRERGLTADILVNNAGFTTTGPVHRADHSREVALVRTDVEAVVDLCTLFVPSMVDRGNGAVLNTASTAAFQPLPGQAAYAAAKSFVLSYTQALRAEVRGRGVNVTALCPGPVETGFATAAGVSDADAHDSLPGFMWIPAAEVARAGIDALAAGRPLVIPGSANKLGALAGYVAPRSVMLPLVAKRHPSLKGS